MNFASIISIVALVVGVMVAILGLRFGSAPGWGRYRSLAAVGLTAAMYAAFDALWASGVSDEVRWPAACFQGSVSVFHVVAWQSYVRKHLGLPSTRLDHAILALLVVLAGLWLVPGFLAARTVTQLDVPWAGVTYRFPGTTLAGSLVNFLEIGLLGVPLARYLRARRTRPFDATVHILALGAIFVGGVHDTLVSFGVLRSLLLISLGFILAVGALGAAMTRLFVESLRELDHLSRSLERLVAERTDALVAAEATLFRTEKMAALGQLAAGVAHEINNPAAAIEANLAYLLDAVDRGQMPTDGRECVDESLQAIARITRIVTQLLDSGRAAANARSGGGAASVLDAVQEAVASARPQLGEHIVTRFDIPESLFVRADASSLVQVLVNLAVNAAQAIPAERGYGQVEIRTKVEGERVHIQVVDDGTGMTDETRRRLFEPFFTTKIVGVGTGLGLSVSLGLLRSMGGEMLVASSPRGTTMTIVLDRGERERESRDRTSSKRIAIAKRGASY